MEKYMKEKEIFSKQLSNFAQSLKNWISQGDQWTIRGFIDVFKNIYTISTDTKVISKILEIHLFPHFLAFADRYGYQLELATCQNWYPDMTFISKSNPDIKFAVDLKTTYRDEEHPDFCNGFTLGSHGTYFIDRNSTKNIQYPYNTYSGHFCLGIIYSRLAVEKYSELRKYSVEEMESIPAVIGNFIFLLKRNGKLQVIKVEAAILRILAVYKRAPLKTA